MKKLVLLLVMLGFAVSAMAQGDLPTTKPLEIGRKNNLDALPSNQGTVLRMPSVLDKDLISKENPIKMLPDKNLARAGHDLKLDPKIKAEEHKGSVPYFGDMYLGDFKTNAKFVGIVARDHEYIDGDRVKIMVNDQVIEYNLLLSGAYKGLYIPYHDCPKPCVTDFGDEIALEVGTRFYGPQRWIQNLCFPIAHHHHPAHNN